MKVIWFLIVWGVYGQTTAQVSSKAECVAVAKIINDHDGGKYDVKATCVSAPSTELGNGG